MKPFLPHSALEFKCNEIRTLEYICNRSFFAGTYPDLQNAIDSYYGRYTGFIRGKKNFDFKFTSDFDIEIEGIFHRIIVYAKVSGNYDLVTYALGISDKDDPYELIRRFHFDYDHKKIRDGQKAFISHLQYGGVSGVGFIDSSKVYRTTNLVSKLSVPRLSFYPMNLALLLDIIFCEFQNETTKKIIEHPDWRTLIKENEVFVLSHYFNPISAHIRSVRHNKDTLIRDFCYA